MELELQSIHGMTLTGDPMQVDAHERFVKNMKRRLANKPELIDELLLIPESINKARAISIST